METKIDFDKSYVPSQDIVAREVQGEFILIPVTSGMDEDEDAIFSLNETGRLIWDKLGKKKSIRDIVSDLSLEFSASTEEVREDVLGLLGELLKRKMITRP